MRASTIVLLHSLVLVACRPVPLPEPSPRPPVVVAPQPALVVPDSCTYDDECPAGEICDGEACLLAPAQPHADDVCGVAPIEFARDSARLSPNNQSRIAAALACLSDKRVILAACRAEPAEPAELARQRADAVLRMLMNLGMSNDLVVIDLECESGRSVGLRVWQ
jgi:hypothetical protein